MMETFSYFYLKHSTSFVCLSRSLFVAFRCLRPEKISVSGFCYQSASENPKNNCSPDKEIQSAFPTINAEQVYPT